ncbi:hypothetical protein ILUMI_15568, partial [Ignelater luminosus]
TIFEFRRTDVCNKGETLHETIYAYEAPQMQFQSGFAYKFEIYAGQEESQVSSDQPDFGITGNTVLRFCKDIPRKQNYRLYHDNNYTSLSLIVYLAKEGIHSVGTVRRNRIPNCKLPTDSTLKSQPRGTSYEYVASVEGVDISITWKDNKCVTLLSSFVGRQDQSHQEQAEFRAALAETLCNIGRCPLKRGRPSALENKIAEKRRKGRTQHVPPREVRTDQLGHWPILEAKKMRCKYPTCKGFTHTKCEKCGIALCLNKSNKCFRAFHTQ